MNVISPVTDAYSKLHIGLEGEIAPGDDAHLQKLLRNRNANGVHIDLDSTGGDFRTAIAIGRLLRRAEASVSTGNCLSVCVFVFAGAVDRIVFLNSSGVSLGVHRLYFSDVKATTSQAAIAQARAKLKADAAAYLQEMNVSTRLLDLMEGTPPEEMRGLAELEIKEMGLDSPDPVWDERQVAIKSAERGVVSREYRRRRALTTSACEAYRVFSPQHTSCVEAVLWNLQIDEYKARRVRYLSWFKAARETNENVSITPAMRVAGDACERAIFISGAGSCPAYRPPSR